MELGTIPVINQNDTVSTLEIAPRYFKEDMQVCFSDNDKLSALVASELDADLLIILSDIDGLYDSDPRKNPDAAKIPVVSHIDDKIREMAGGSGSNRGTGGMATKITAAAAATGAGIHCCVMSGNDPANIYKLIEGQPMGTLFTPAEGSM